MNAYDTKRINVFFLKLMIVLALLLVLLLSNPQQTYAAEIVDSGM